MVASFSSIARTLSGWLTIAFGSASALRLDDQHPLARLDRSDHPAEIGDLPVMTRPYDSDERPF